ncbi:MAG: GspH/FimT family pseudopilin [Pseudomonas oryzihabitans]
MTSIVAHRRQFGLTLIELCIAVLLLAIGTSIALPSMQALIDRQHQASTLLTLTAQLDYARQQGVQRGQPVRVCPLDATDVCGTDWSLGWQVLDAEDRTLVSTASLHRRQRLLLSSPSAAGIVYQSNGTTQMGNGTFVLCNLEGDPLWALVINRQGRLRPRSPEADDHARCNARSGQT